MTCDGRDDRRGINWPTAWALVGVALAAAAGPVAMVWASNAAQRIMARAAVEMEEEGVDWTPDSEQ